MSAQDSIPTFAHARQGYDRGQVDEYVRDLALYANELEAHVRSTETRLKDCRAELAEVRRDLAAAPGAAGVPERLAQILRLAGEEADEIRAQARRDADETIQQAKANASQMLADAQQKLATLDEQVFELDATRDKFVERLVFLSGELARAIEYHRSPITPSGSQPPDPTSVTAEYDGHPAGEIRHEDLAATTPISPASDDDQTTAVTHSS